MYVGGSISLHLHDLVLNMNRSGRYFLLQSIFLSGDRLGYGRIYQVKGVQGWLNNTTNRGLWVEPTTRVEI